MNARSGLVRLSAAWRALYPHGIPPTDFDVAALMALVAMSPPSSTPPTATELPAENPANPTENPANPTENPANPPPTKLLGANEVGALLGIKSASVSWLHRSGTLTAVERRGRALMFKREDVDALVNARKATGTHHGPG